MNNKLFVSQNLQLLPTCFFGDHRMPFEIFVVVMRNETVESRHFGAAVVCDRRGRVLHGWGDVEQLVFPRSALKPMLAIDLVESGASEHFGLSDAELALSCASHQGEMMHKDLVEAWLARLGLTQEHI
ncbi:MAG: asparaginase, partial [Alphaproteobacteria bacterium]|nr:asparaginase [Alphaproteobacteria bacterium]